MQATISVGSLMYSRKNIGPRMEPWGTLALTRYSCEDFPCITTWCCLLLRKEEIRPKISDQKYHKIHACEKKQACLTHSNALDISDTTARVEPDLLNVLAILSDTNVARSAVHWEDPKPY